MSTECCPFIDWEDPGFFSLRNGAYMCDLTDQLVEENTVNARCYKDYQGCKFFCYYEEKKWKMKIDEKLKEEMANELDMA
ncbi:hypothetical protein [Desertibacillus haloalkaliphilus]|uniref:hypothetical protein n=1 Tax=Desertibacillus haloalkaliphilus TaxID=1328930 RepID=UPI001C264673|nr:hypothetical protein [Desertibacillus haloalkaliphilus]MBU8906863.1 hypothetical protein [Desertibacillus haloalkaliphilus]